MGGRAKPTVHLDADSFVAQAQMGDVVLMANTTHVSHLIRYGTRRPFSHAGLVVDGKATMRSAYPGHPGHEGAVHDDSLAVLLDDLAGGGGAHKFDEVFLLRPALGDDQVVSVVAESLLIMEAAKSFHQFDIARLVMMLLCQEPYRGDGLKSPAHHRVRDAAMIRFALEQMADWIKADDDPSSLVCSEFVYRAFAGAGFPPDLPNPIVKLGPTTGAGKPNPVAPGGSVLAVGLEHGRLERLRSVLDAGVDYAHDKATDLLDELDDLWDRIGDVVFDVQEKRAEMAPMDAELITPGDLIGSPDLHLEHVYLRTSWFDVDPTD